MEGSIETVVFRFRPDDPDESDRRFEIRIVTLGDKTTGAFRRDICLAKGISETKVTRHLTDAMRGSWRGRGHGGIRTYETVDSDGILALLPIRPRSRTPESDRRCAEFEIFARTVILPMFGRTSSPTVTSGRDIELIPHVPDGWHGPAFRPIFDEIMHVDERGKFWKARELQDALEYDPKNWQNFENVISKARVNCRNSGFDDEEHFQSNFLNAKEVRYDESKSGPKPTDYRLTKYACYLIALNADASKQRVAEAKTYFAVMTDFAERRVAIQSPLDGDQIELLLRAALDHRQQLRKLTSRVEVIEEQACLRDEEAIRLVSQLAEEQDRIKDRQEAQERERVRLDQLEKQAKEGRDERELQQQEIDSLRERQEKIESRPVSVVAPGTQQSRFYLVREYAREHGFTGRRSIQGYHNAIGTYLTQWVDSECFSGRGVESDYIKRVIDRFLVNDTIMEKPINKYNEEKVFKVKWMDALKSCCPKLFFKLFPETGFQFGE